MTFNEKYKDNALLVKTFSFALKIIDYTEELQEKKKFVIGNQLLKSGTSVGSNSKEAQNAESKADFIHKLKISAKEADEVQYWLTLCEYSNTYPNSVHLNLKLTEIQKILNSILGIAKRKSPISFLLSYFLI